MPVSGMGGDVERVSGTDIVDVNGFTFNEEAFTTRFGSSDSAGFKKTFAGVRGAAGEIRTKYDESVAPALVTGASFALELFKTATKKISAPSIIKTRSLEVDMDDGAVISEVLGYETNGAWTET